jgi:hypothetical protein
VTRSDLLDVAYRFYPRSLFDGAPGDRESEKRDRQLEVARRAVAEHPTWRAMLRRLGYSFMDRAEWMRSKSYLEHGIFDPAYAADLYLPGRTVGFYVCLLGPYYGIYRTGAPDEEPAALQIAHEIEATYPGYEPIPPELGNELVPGLTVTGAKAGHTTIYHCLLSPLWESSSWADDDDLEALARAQGLLPDTAPRPEADDEDDPPGREVVIRIR